MNHDIDSASVDPSPPPQDDGTCQGRRNLRGHLGLIEGLLRYMGPLLGIHIGEEDKGPF